MQGKTRGRRGETSTMSATDRVLNYKHKPREPKLTGSEKPTFRKGPRWREALRPRTTARPTS